MDLDLLAIILGAMYIFYKEIKYNNLKDKHQELLEMVSIMAKELQELGSPNIKIIEKNTNEKIPKT